MHPNVTPPSPDGPKAGVKRARSVRFAAALCALTLAATPTAAQDAATADGDPLGPPTERGIRLTPEMARSMAAGFTREVLVRRYELDQAKADEAGELIARRMMAAAHQHDEDAQTLVEMFLTELAEDDARHRENAQLGDDDTFMTPEFCRKLAQHVLPMTPTLRDLIRGVGQDVRPLLPLKQQLKLGADLTMIGGTMTVFENNMQRWAQGQAAPSENPFRSDGNPSARDASGQSNALKAARRYADNEVNREKQVRSVWENYLKQTKTFYALDEGQCATADSVYREFTARLQTTLADSTWRERMHRTCLLLGIGSNAGISWRNPLREMIHRQYDQLTDPIDTLGDEFRIRLDQIPTTAQRTAAEARVAEALVAHGYRFTPSTQEN